jgi:phage/plasmid primase-like uncharacterized protein
MNEWRIKGIPEDDRFDSIKDAIKRQKTVQSWKPQRLKSRREARSKRPCRETAERVHHSRGKKWAEFIQRLGNNFSEQEALRMMDSSRIGGNEVFATWKQREYEAWRTIDTVRILEFADRRVIMVRQKDGTVTEVPFIEPEGEKKTKKRFAGKIKNCATCSSRLQSSERHRKECTKCRPVVTATSFFQSLTKES